MKVLSVTTKGATIRSEIIGWTYEDIDCYVPNKPIGFSPSGQIDRLLPDTIMEALANGWKLLGPPTIEEHEKEFYSNWWLTKE